MIHSLAKKHEFYIFCIIVLFSAVISMINPNFLTVGNIFSMLKDSIVIGILALGVLLVLISGGIDVSFPVVSAFSLYMSLLFFRTYYIESPLWIVYIAAMLIGALCGLLNGVLIAFYKFPTLVVTLGTSGLISGFMYTFVGTQVNHTLPATLVEFGKSMFWVSQSNTGQTIGLPYTIWILVLLYVLCYLFLEFTFLGRCIYAIGGDSTSAERAGINTIRVKIFIYVLVGILASIAGITRASFLRVANPFELYGYELTVIAATVLGGAYISGGKGSVIGTFLGVLLITIINNSLIIIGVSSYWQKVAIGIVILFSVSVPIVIRNMSK